MKAIVISQFGGPEELHVKTLDTPSPGANQVLVKVAYAGLNPVDTKIRSGKHVSCKNLQLPAILGRDMSGTVVAVGPAVKQLQIGNEVFGFVMPTYAEYLLAAEVELVKKPSSVSFEEAAAVSLAGLTAYQAIHEHLQVQAGQKILVQSAAGGVGHLAVQLAKLAGAIVSGTASAKNLDFIRQLGVDHAIDYQSQRFEDEATDLDAVMDTMGGEVLYRSIACVKPGGRVVCLPSFTKDDPKALALAKERQVELIWFMMKPHHSQLEQLANLMADGKLHVEVSGIFSMDDVSESHERIESHGVRGKLLMKIE